MDINRIFLIVLDSFGIGMAPDAALFNDEGSNTLATICKSPQYHTPNMERLGLFNIEGVDCMADAKDVIGSYGRLTEASMGKDTTIGHWEISGIISQEPLPTYPEGFPKEVLDEFEKCTGRGTLCNKPYSGTDVIRDYGREHVKSGKLIVYTSADSVFQIAAHEDVLPIDTLYEYCRIARKILQGKHGVGRVIARPFVGEYPDYQRTSNRHDFSLIPPKTTMLDVLCENGFATIGIGKIYDIFAGKGVKEHTYIKNNTDGMEKTIAYQNKDFKGLCFVNLVDFDMVYGHRNNIDGYANAASAFDQQLGEFMKKMKPDDVLLITADHGCDPGFAGTDHTRERVPLLAYGEAIKQNHSIGTRDSFADIAATVLEVFQISGDIAGESFLNELIREENRQKR